MAKLSLRHVSKRYPNGFWAVKDFNLEMEDGEFVILTGSPKCGKSTVLRMIAGAEDVTEGILELDGKYKAYQIETRFSGAKYIGSVCIKI